jgi:hypothetical protein
LLVKLSVSDIDIKKPNDDRGKQMILRFTGGLKSVCEMNVLACARNHQNWHLDLRLCVPGGVDRASNFSEFLKLFLNGSFGSRARLSGQGGGQERRSTAR